MSFDWKSIVGTFAPTVASILGTPLAGAGIAVLTKVLGLGDNASEHDVEKEVDKKGISPQQIVALKKADYELKMQLSKDGIDLNKLHSDNVKAAREHAIETNDHSTPRLILILSFVLFALCLIGAFGLFLFVPIYTKMYNITFVIPEGLSYLLGTLTGVAAALVRSSVDYYMGSSTGSAAKNELLYNSIPSENKMPTSGNIATGENLFNGHYNKEDYKKPIVTQPTTTPIRPQKPNPPTTLPEGTSKYPSTGAPFPPENHYTRPSIVDPETSTGSEDNHDTPSVSDTNINNEYNPVPTGISEKNSAYGGLDAYQTLRRGKNK